MRIAKRLEKGSYAHRTRLPAPAKTGEILEELEKDRPDPPPQGDIETAIDKIRTS